MIYDQDDPTVGIVHNGPVVWCDPDDNVHVIRIDSRPPRSVPNAPERDPAVLTSELRLGLAIAATWFTAGFFAGILFSIVR